MRCTCRLSTPSKMYGRRNDEIQGVLAASGHLVLVWPERSIMSDVERTPNTDGEIGELMRRDPASLSKSERDGADNAPEQTTEKLESLIRTVGEVSTEEIDREQLKAAHGG